MWTHLPGLAGQVADLLAILAAAADAGLRGTALGPLGVLLDQLKATRLDLLFVQLTVQVFHPGVYEAIELINAAINNAGLDINIHI